MTLAQNPGHWAFSKYPVTSLTESVHSRTSFIKSLLRVRHRAKDWRHKKRVKSVPTLSGAHMIMLYTVLWTGRVLMPSKGHSLKEKKRPNDFNYFIWSACIISVFKN